MSAAAGVSAASFTAHRRSLFGLAYRMLGSAAEAEDVVQEAYLRAQAAREAPESPGAYLATIVTRLCLDVMKSARARREAYVGPWLPEPVPTGELLGGDGDAAEPLDARGVAESPAARMDRVESISMAFLVVLESLSPLERAALILRDVFDWEFDAVAAALGRSPAACRQLVHRAREHVAARQPRFRATEAERTRLFGAFLEAAARGDAGALAAMLAEGASATPDSGGKASSARRTLRGKGPIARYFIGLWQKAARAGALASARIGSVNGGPALLIYEGARLTTVMGLDLSPAGIDTVWIVRNPDKLARLESRLGSSRPLHGLPSARA
ncbi:RNA polymerase sigma factor SigJ [Sorangium sp. So ce131]|uniref:RNA polymerase sigma factor SigJ n=1 Tax=Sorangium sp. So ce131 TaxID=3133282 RepID=UPI003F5D6D7C